jgi:MSHA biogenesis protein MshQ
VRFYSRGTPSQLILDTANVITNNTWYFVAAVADVPNKTKRIYVYNTAGTKLSEVSATWTETSFGSDSGIASIGGETNAAGENTNSFGFSGNIDEVSVFGSALSQSAIQSVLALTHPCTASSIDHIRIEHDGDGLTCMPETVTVKACADPACATLYTGSTTVTLSGSGWTANPITFTSGSGTTDLSITTPQTVTLGTNTVSPLPSHATNCYIGTTADCSLVFTDAGFIFAESAGGAEATIPSQIASISSGTYYLRAVKKNYTTMACEAALTGATTVNFAYECNDPATCYAADLMSVNGGSATTIARNNNGSVSSYTSVNMTFDANGNAPFTFSYGDAGKVTLHAKKAVNSVTLTGASNAFVVKPYDFGVIPCASSVIGNCTTAPADPGLLGGGSVFAKAGAAFKATVTARTATGTATPSFGLGSNNATETVSLTHTRVAPTGSGTADGTLGGTTSIPRSSFTNGIATVSDLNWNEAGVITLTATNSTFLGNALTTTGTTGNLGRFIPDHFAITTGSVTEGCDAGNFTYFGQDGFSTGFTLTAQNTANATTLNYTGNFAKFDLTAWNNYNFTAAWLPAAPSPASTLLASATAPTGTWNNGTASVIAKHLASRPAAPVAPATITVNAQPADTDGVTMAPAVAVQTAATPLRYGRIVLQNAYGPETAPLKMRLLTQYYDGTAFIGNPDDTCSKYSATGLTCSNLIGPVTCTDVVASGVDISNGQYFILSAPMKTGTLLYTLTVDPWLQYEWDNVTPQDYNENPAGRANFGIYRGNDRIINWREIIR